MNLRILWALAVPAMVTVACGGDPTEEPRVEAGEGVLPDWFRVDPEARQVTLTLVAGATPDNSYWNFNGYHSGAGRIRVPVGWDVEVELLNHDPAMVHSVAVDPQLSDFPRVFEHPQPAFQGAVTPNPTSEEAATPPGGRDRFRFRAGEVGTYGLVCYVPGHAAVGMYLTLEVVASGGAAFIP